MTVLVALQELGDVPAGDDWLTPREKQDLARLRLPKRRADWRLGRWTGKRALESFGGKASWEVRAAADGAPEVFVEGKPAPLVMSLSHTSGCAVCAVASAGVRLGVDLEVLEPRSQEFIADFFSGEEQDCLGETWDATTLVNLFWSAKESALKALRTGLREDTRGVRVVQWEDKRLAVYVMERGETLRGVWRTFQGLVLTLLVAPSEGVDVRWVGCSRSLR
jgi:4'-phosphopantetheinyl transferase